MALSQSTTLNNNFNEPSTFPDAYIRVEKVETTKQSSTALVATYKEAEGQFLVSNLYGFVPDLTGANHIQQAYEYLKTLPEFANATDC